MARHALLLLVLIAAVLVVPVTAAPELVAHGRTASGWMRAGAREDACLGTLEECLGEYEVGADVIGLRRRRLVDDGEENGGYGGGGGSGDGTAPPQYISYAALTRDSVPCSIPGASYYNCRPGADANSYTRGCSAITQCRD